MAKQPRTASITLRYRTPGVNGSWQTARLSIVDTFVGDTRGDVALDGQPFELARFDGPLPADRGALRRELLAWVKMHDDDDVEEIRQTGDADDVARELRHRRRAWLHTYAANI